MDNFGNIHPLAFEPVRKILAAAYRSRDFRAADEVIVRNTVKEAVMIHRLVNGAMDAYCWSGVRGTSYMLSRTSHPDTRSSHHLSSRSCVGRYQCQTCRQGRPQFARWRVCGWYRACDSGIEEELAERFGIYITPDVYERFGCVDEGPERGESVRSYARDDAREISSQER